MNTKRSLYASAMLLAASAASAQSSAGNTVTVTVDNFPRAESDMYFAAMIKHSGCRATLDWFVLDHS